MSNITYNGSKIVLNFNHKQQVDNDLTLTRAFNEYNNFNVRIDKELKYYENMYNINMTENGIGLKCKLNRLSNEVYTTQYINYSDYSKDNQVIIKVEFHLPINCSMINYNEDFIKRNGGVRRVRS
jgi:hypothetical protein